MTSNLGDHARLAALMKRIEQRIQQDDESRHDDTWLLVSKGEARSLLALLRAQPSPQPLEVLFKKARCAHEHRSGGNDYIECGDCGLIWDYRRETADQALMQRLRELAAVPVVPPSPEFGVCKECGCTTGRNEYCYQHQPYLVWPLKDGSFYSDRNGRRRVWLDEPPSVESETVGAVVPPSPPASEEYPSCEKFEPGGSRIAPGYYCRKCGNREQDHAASPAGAPPPEEQGPLCRCPAGTCYLHPSLTTCGMREPAAGARPSAPVSPWLPIETAPKDGTQMLVLCCNEVRLGFWSGYAYVTVPGRYTMSNPPPTHWMPPPPPLSAEGSPAKE